MPPQPTSHWHWLLTHSPLPIQPLGQYSCPYVEQYAFGSGQSNLPENPGTDMEPAAVQLTVAPPIVTVIT